MSTTCNVLFRLHVCASFQGVVSCLAVNVVVAHPAAWDTGRVSTLELTGATGGRRTLQLVRAVTTFVLTVAHKVAWNATPAGTGELIWSTGDVAWGQLGEEEADVRAEVVNDWVAKINAFVTCMKAQGHTQHFTYSLIFILLFNCEAVELKETANGMVVLKLTFHTEDRYLAYVTTVNTFNHTTQTCCTLRHVYFFMQACFNLRHVEVFLFHVWFYFITILSVCS